MENQSQVFNGGVFSGLKARIHFVPCSVRKRFEPGKITVSMNLRMGHLRAFLENVGVTIHL